jgi:tetratricopeptide (TPR) repeat protein
MEEAMDRILRIVSGAMAAAALTIAALIAPATAADTGGQGLAQAAAPPEALVLPSPPEDSAPLLLAPEPISAGRPSGHVGSSGGAARAGDNVGKNNPAAGGGKSDESPTAAPLELASPLQTAAAECERSEHLERIAQQADRQTRHGFELAGRGARFAARSEFLAALKLVAEGLDTEQKTGAHGRALTAALTAMKEADDFLPDGSRLEASIDLSRILASHATPVLKNETANLTPLTALKCYFTFAQEQFAAAVGHEVAGSMALHALGKLHEAMAHQKSGPLPAAEPKAMVYFQAAILVYPKNFMAANDLGVLLARCGNCEDARRMLEYSLAISPQSATWHNLAVVYGQLSQATLARRAEQQAGFLQQAEAARRVALQGTANNAVQWVDPQSFAATSTSGPGVPAALPRPASQASQASVQPRRLPPVPAGAQPTQPPTAAERMSWGIPGYQR